MMWHEIETRLRRMLRDPDGRIWTSEELMAYFNDAQIEIQQKSHLLERVEVYRYPPFYTWTHLWDWEDAFTEGDRRTVLMPLETIAGMVACYPWEAFWWGTSVIASSPGYRHTQIWEIYYGASDDIVEVPLHAQFARMKFAAFDRRPLEPISGRELAQRDASHRTRAGVPTRYWRPDDFHNRLALYPRPATIVWQDEPEPHVVLDDTGAGGMITYSEEYLDTVDTGLVTDVIRPEGALMCVYEPVPSEILSPTDNPDWPDWAIKYVEYATLERAYRADSDGFIPSLRDYWKLRKEIALKMLQRYRVCRLQDRDFVMGATSGRQTSRLRLPDGYPAVYP